ncbi:hypothetical protein GMRT_12941 [Giardia muris]|uniref:Uncharacterized protein n=1 Tax=Giardia muris TaxID=5742 RepID=A0A4Z1STL6_GIAMU|nr:hypothetical protein GMRT_12941 [Giardia muris]|eukprot:TNJ29090.1 hypothetical protein GMRT_12941 [Giardia muris]
MRACCCHPKGVEGQKTDDACASVVAVSDATLELDINPLRLTASKDFRASSIWAGGSGTSISLHADAPRSLLLSGSFQERRRRKRKVRRTRADRTDNDDIIKQLAPSLAGLAPSTSPEEAQVQSPLTTRQVVTTRINTNTSMLWLTGRGISESQSQEEEHPKGTASMRDSQDRPEKVYENLDLSSSRD